MKLIKNIFILTALFIGFVILAKTVGALLWGVVKVVFFVAGAVWFARILLSKDDDEKHSIWSNK